MTAPFRLFGAETSPYSLKLRSYLRFKGLEFEWLERSQARQEEFARYAKVPLAPVLVDADENVLQDSTLAIEALERDFPEPSITPDDPALAFLAALIEDYADEWLSKAMYHYRWTYPEDQDAAAQRIADMLFAGVEAPSGVADSIKTRMAGRLHHIGSTPQTAAVIEASFARLIGDLDAMLAARPYVLGGRPSHADFALYGQLAQLLSDPTPGALLRARAPKVVAWIERMQSPRAEGEFAAFDAVAADAAALLRDEIAGAFLAWASANAHAVADDAPMLSFEIAGQSFTQKPQRTAAKGFAELRRKRALAVSAALDELLASSGCDAFLVLAVSDDDEPDSDTDADDSED